MNETKSVKVDNWGVFFLQKLQNFFNRTDYCDLTLQFNDNSQLKVHRLVLSACTDYFNLLEQQCEMIDDILIMPDELQADVVVPIVNFMYTGTLEFQYSMFDKLLKTAKDMNMTVLLKLLEAHHLATRNIRKPANPVVLNKQAPRNLTGSNSSNLNRSSITSSQRRIPGKNVSVAQKIVYKHHQTTIAPMGGTKVLPEPIQVITKYSHAMQNTRGPTRFEVDDQTLEAFEGQFDNISYESKPLLTAEQIKREEESSTFERLKKDVTIKRPPLSSLTSPPAKKPNLEDVKEFTENIRLRKQLAGEEDDTDEYFDDNPFDDDDDDVQPVNKNSSGGKSYGSSSGVAVKTSPRTTISIKEDSGNVNHAKIISEVLKKYPHLVKNNKNIKLKIMQKGPESTTQVTQKTPPTAKVYPTKITSANQQTAKAIQNISPQVKLEQKSTVIQAGAHNKPRRIDAKTMHELIAKGAENTSGPWLCLRCGIDGRPISIPSYKSFRRHLVTVHKERIDSKLCEECGYKSTSRNDLHYHLLKKHEIQPPKEIRFPKCTECGHVSATQAQLQKHTQEEHTKRDTSIKTIQQCCYCDKVFIKESTLMSHIKQYHRDQALEDGVIDSDDGYVPNNPNADSKQIKVLSSVSLPAKGLQFVLDPNSGQQVTQIGGKSNVSKLEPSSEAEALSKVASGIATSLQLVGTEMGLEEEYHQDISTQYIPTSGNDDVQLGGETKILTEDGTELQLTQSQKDEILSQLQSADGNNVIMILNQESYETTPNVVTEDTSPMVVFSQGDINSSSSSTFVTAQASSISQNDEAIIVNMRQLDRDSEDIAEPTKSIDSLVESHESIQKEIESSAPPLSKEEEGTILESKETSKENNTMAKNDSQEIETELEKLEANALNSNLATPIDKTTQHEMLEKSDTFDEAEKAKQNLISTLQGDWTEESEDETLIHKPEETKQLKITSPVLEPALFEDLEKKPDEADTSDSKIADAVDDLLNELQGDFPNEDDKKGQANISVDSNDKGKDSKIENTENKELSKLMDDWDDEDL
uniref:CSON013676 protein n=1 Tax=Culicoides sonorensis TaxID=179676 RepID=A0A336LLY0_CULSO